MLDRLLCRAWILRRSALPAVCAEDGDFHTAVLLPVIPRFLTVDWLGLAPSHDLEAIHRDVVLPYEIGLYGLGTPAAELEVVFGSPRLVREALNGHEVTLNAAHLIAAQLIELLFGLIRQFRGIKFEEHDDITGGLVIVDICHALVQLAMKLIGEVRLYLVGFLGGGVRSAEGVARTSVSGIRLFGGCADLRLVTL